MKPVHEAFSKTCKLLLGADLGNLDEYEEWLKRNVRWKREVKSEASAKKVGIPKLAFFDLAKRGFVTMEESDSLGRQPSKVKNIETLSLANASKSISPIAYFTPEVLLGENFGLEDMCTCFSSQHSIRGIYSNTVKYTSYCYWPRNSEYVFGCSMVFSCQFCMKCYNSENLTRCFEVSDSHSCSDCYFCHNCENVRDSMFCFNAKNLKFAIGNQEMGRDEYLRIRKMVLAHLSAELSKNKTFPLSIFSVAHAGKPSR